MWAGEECKTSSLLLSTIREIRNLPRGQPSLHRRRKREREWGIGKEGEVSNGREVGEMERGSEMMEGERNNVMDGERKRE